MTSAMSVIAAEPVLGVGLYSAREAALYARVRPQLMARWLFGGASGEAVIDRQLKSEDRIITFLDFVQAMAVRAVRIERKVPLQKIRQAIQNAEQKYGVSRPFARKHKTFLNGDEIVIKINDDELVEVTGRHAHNRVIKEVAELYMIDVGFDPDGIASRYTPLQQGEIAVTMNPAIRFGEPVLMSCGYTAKALWEAFKVEGGIDPAALVCGVTPAEVELACRYYDNLLSLAV